MVGRGLRDATSGTASGGTATTLIDATKLISPSNTFVNYFLRMTSGTFSGQDRLVTAHSQAARQVTFDPPLSAPVVNGDRYQLLPVRRELIEEALQSAVRAAGATWMVQATKDDITITHEQEYALPVDLFAIQSVYVGIAGYWYPQTAWEMSGNFGAYKLMLRQWARFPLTRDDQVAGATWDVMRVDYVALPALASASDTLGLGDFEGEAVEFLREYALYLLKAQSFDANPTSEAARAAFTSSQTHYQNAMTIKTRARSQAQPGRVRTRAIPRHVQ
jgi:hypothetical protein